MGLQFAFPFRLTPRGTIATVDQDSELGRRDQVAHLLLTRPGEREVLPGFGVEDPRYVGVDAGAVATAVSTYLPAIAAPVVTATDNNDGTQRVTVDVK